MLYDAYKHRLYGYVLAITHSSHAAEEVTQELFIKLWMDREKLEQVDNMEAYIFTMVRNRTFNYLRSAANNARVLNELKKAMVWSGNNVESRLTKQDYEDIIKEALEQLSPKRRLVFRLSRYQGLKLDEIAVKLDLSRNTVKNHLVAALKFIRAYLAKRGVPFLLALLFFLK